MTKKNLRTKSVNLPRSIRRLFPNVKYAVDSNVPMHVSVNRADCKTGKKLDPTECALARATKREHHADGAIIGLSSSYVIKGDKAIRFATPDSVQREIISFDRHQDFAPGDYVLIPKAPTVKFGASRSEKKNTGGKHKAKRILHTSARVRVLPTGKSK